MIRKAYRHSSKGLGNTVAKESAHRQSGHVVTNRTSKGGTISLIEIHTKRFTQASVVQLFVTIFSSPLVLLPIMLQSWSHISIRISPKMPGHSHLHLIRQSLELSSTPVPHKVS